MIGIIIAVLAIIVLIVAPFIIVGRNDPVKHCDYYKDNGCAHVDGFLCTYPDCEINNEYLRIKKK